MNNQSNTPSLFSYFLTLTFAVFISIPFSYADDDDGREYMGMGYGHMGQGHMGYGGMGQGHMGYGHMGSHRMGMMGMGHMGPGSMSMGHMGMGHNYTHMLDLTDSQRKTIRSIQKSIRTQQLTLHDKLTEHADKLYSLYKKDKPNAKKISRIYKNIFEIKLEQIELSINTKNKIYDVLNKEQKKKIKEWKSSGMGNHQHRGQQGSGMHHMMK